MSVSALGELLILFIASQPECKCNIPNNESAGQHQQSDFHRPISIQAQTAVIRQFCLTFCRVVCANYTLASNNNNLNAFRSFFLRALVSIQTEWNIKTIRAMFWRRFANKYKLLGCAQKKRTWRRKKKNYNFYKRNRHSLYGIMTVISSVVSLPAPAPQEREKKKKKSNFLSTSIACGDVDGWA